MGAIKVTEDALADVKKIAKKQGLSNGEFVGKAAQFILESGIDLKDGYSIKKEIKENNKRLHQVIGWFKTQEDDFIIPVFQELRNLNEKTRAYLNNLRPDDILTELKNVANSNKELTEIVKKQSETIANLTKSNNAIGRAMEITLKGFAVDSQFKESDERKEARAKAQDYIVNAR
jgi:hypothetical protein